MCDCQKRCCKCLPATIFTWTGDRDFTGDLDIRTYPGYFSELTDRQPVGTTSMFWRIRYAPDQAFIEYLTNSKTLIAGSELDGTAFIDLFPHSNTSAFLSGPVRDGIMYGLDMVPAGRFANNIYRWPSFSPGDPFTAAVDYNFIGSINLKNYNTNGGQPPGNWTAQDHPDNPIDLPWALEIGCSRCGCVDGITWPNIDVWQYDPANYYQGTVAIDPDASTLVSTRVTGCCQSKTADDLQSLYWPGDEAEPNHAATCPPDCVVWVSDTWGMTDPQFGIPGGYRSIPGKSLPVDAPEHPATSLAAAEGGTNQLDGWTGRLNGVDVARAARGDSAAIDNVPCIWLVNPYYTLQPHQDMLVSYSMSAGDVQWIIDWLALGNKTLIVDAPWNHVTGTSSNPSGLQQPNISNANAFLSWIGSSLSLYAIEDIWSGGTYPFRAVAELDCVATQQHALVPVPHTLFSSVAWPAGSSLLSAIPFGSGYIDPTATGISGGTALYQYDCVIRNITAPLQTPGSTYDTNETHPVIAVEEMVNGSRIITGAISVSNVVHAELRQGLSSITGVGDLIARIIQSA